MSLQVKKNISPAEELNLLLTLIPLNHPAKTEVGSFLNQITNIQNGNKPDGSSYPPGSSIPSKDELISQLTMSTLVDKGFEILIKTPTTQQTAVKNFILSAIKDGENVDVGSLAAAFLPKEALDLISKVFQTELIGKNIFQLKDIALKRLHDLENQATSILKQAQSFTSTISAIATTYGELPGVNNALVEMTAVARGISDVVEFVESKIEEVYNTLDDITRLAEDTPSTTAPPGEPSTPGTLPPVPDSVTSGDLPTPTYPELEPEPEDEEETDVIFD